MTSLTAVARFHLVQRLNYRVMPWAILGFTFAVDVVILKLTPAGHSHARYVGGLAGPACVVFALGVQSVASSLPFGLALGMSRRTYYLGTLALAAALAVAGAAVITVGQAVERGTGGWGLTMDYFRVPYLLDGHWYLTALTSFVILTLLFVYGLWFGLVHRRWSMPGLAAFGAGQISLLTLGAMIATWAGAWHSIGRFFTDLSAAGLTGLLAAVAVALMVGGFATVRRLTV